jgi:crossover junction endodeoxyribonuclease RuvC
MCVLGIDQSFTGTGIVVLNESGNVDHLQKITSEKGSGRVNQIMTISNEILDIISKYKITTVKIEGLSLGSNSSVTRDLAGLMYGILLKIKEEHGIDAEVVAPKSVKKYATGNGNAKKQDMFDALPEDIQKRILELGVKKTTGMYDIADAYFIAKFVAPD